MGNPLSVINKQSESGNTVVDAQCYRYDALVRLADAWTGAGSCPDPAVRKPAAGGVATAAGAYWQTFDYDAIGSRKQLVDHATGGGADRTTTYTNGCTTGCNTTGAQPHTLTRTTGDADPTTFVYDVAGNLMTRTATSGKGQTLKWDDEGNLAEVTTTGASPTTTKYLYDADGKQLIRRDPGRTSLFAGDTEVVASTTAVLGAVRTYALGGSTVAVRSSLPGGGAHYLFTDSRNSGSLTVDTTTQKAARQQFKPYGENRISANTTAWPDMTRGYLGAPKDISTGYTDVGARKYDPALGRFISADPLLQVTDPSQLGGYTYAGDNPITGADPSGLGRVDPDETGCAPGNGGTCGGYVAPAKKKRQPPKQDPVTVTNTGPGKANIGGVTVTRDQVDNLYVFANEMNNAYYMYQNAWGDKWLALDDESKLLYMMRGACTIPGSVCTNAYSHDLQQALGTRAMYNSGCRAACLDEYHANVAGAYAGALAMAMGLGRAAPGIGRSPRGGPACVNSFSPETLVLMADGTTKPIAEVRVGDEVLATDPETGKTTRQKVTWLHINDDRELVDLTIDNPDGSSSTLHTTRHHPFWSTDRKQWVDAADLRPGEELLTVTDHGQPSIGTVRSFAGRQTMYNLTVTETHTYYVLAGITPVLVHNCGLELQDLGAGWYQSPNGLLYGPGSVQGHRITHVLEHGSPDVAGKATHSVFDTGRKGILETVDEAWLQRGTAANIRVEGNRTVYESIPMGRQVGLDGQTGITVVVRNGDEMITAFPQ